jgi:hypothetical protein
MSRLNLIDLAVSLVIQILRYVVLVDLSNNITGSGAEVVATFL